MAKKVLIAYYYCRGENYVNGSIVNLKLGNTEVGPERSRHCCPMRTCSVEDGTPIHGAEAANADLEAREIASLAK